MKRCLLLLLSFFTSSFLLAQSALRGKVTGSDNGQPIHLANVFLSNTSIGTVTAKDGSFVIEHFPSGRYDVVISCVGYEVQVVTVQSAAIPEYLNIVLKPKVHELQEVVVAPFVKDGWQQYGKLFMDQFIGTTALSEQCKLLNPKAVRFRFNKKENKVTAYADEPLVIENRALGYTVTYDLVLFEYSFDSRLFLYQGYPRFEDMNTGRKRVENRWIRNRAEAYKGSLMHFMRSLYRNRIVEDGFEIRRMIVLKPQEKNRIHALVMARPDATNDDGSLIVNDTLLGNGHVDSGFYYRTVWQNRNRKELVFPWLLSGDSIAYAIDSFTAGLFFPYNLHVIYKHKQVPQEYVSQNPLSVRAKSPLMSQLELSAKEPIAVFSNGTFYNGIGLLTSGYWGWWEKLASLLPYDYEPPPDTK